jgi:hypothetical protein
MVVSSKAASWASASSDKLCRALHRRPSRTGKRNRWDGLPLAFSRRPILLLVRVVGNRGGDADPRMHREGAPERYAATQATRSHDTCPLLPSLCGYRGQAASHLQGVAIGSSWGGKSFPVAMARLEGGGKSDSKNMSSRMSNTPSRDHTATELQGRAVNSRWVGWWWWCWWVIWVYHDIVKGQNFSA